jgi:glutaryl-CoA dehydrogenase
MSPLAAGLVHMELNRGDGSLGTFYGVQTGLAMTAIAMLGSAQQQARWLDPMARLEKIGAFALTEPDHGSDSVALETTAQRDGEAWVIEGAKRWIGNGTIADVVVVWARSTDDGEVKGVLVEPDRPGYAATVIDGKGSARAMWQADVRLDGVRVPDSARLPGAQRFRDAGRASFQIVQDRLVKMLADVTAMQLCCMQLARRSASGSSRCPRTCAGPRCRSCAGSRGSRAGCRCPRAGRAPRRSPGGPCACC